MNCLLVMSMTGSVLFLLLVITEYFMPELFSRKYRYRMLKMVFVFFVVPLPVIWENMQKLMIKMNIYQKRLFVYEGEQPTILYVQGIEYKNTAYQTDVLVRNICFGFAAVCLLYHICQYFGVRRQVCHTFHKCPDSEIVSLLQTQKEKMKIKRNVCIYTADFLISPFTIGIFKPIIVVPRFMEKSLMEMAVCHELCHIKNYDGFVKFLYMILRDLYWYQPVMDLIGDYLDRASEMACDEQVTRHMDKAGRKRDGGLLIDLASEGVTCANGYMASMSADRQTIKERIYFIMKGKRKTSVFAAVLSVVLVICSTLAVCAYKPVKILREYVCIEGMDELFGPVEAGESIVVNTDENPRLFYGINEETVVYDVQFTDTDGNICYIKEPNVRRRCTHTYKEGEVLEHNKKTDGGCEVNVYLAKVCTECNAIHRKEPKTSGFYFSCPH